MILLCPVNSSLHGQTEMLWGDHSMEIVCVSAKMKLGAQIGSLRFFFQFNSELIIISY